jgi:hypothetical protein
MDNIELARVKLDRAIRMVEHFEDMNEGDLRAVILYLLRSLDALPRQSSEKLYWYSKLSALLNMELHKYGAIFKATSWKNSMILKRNDVEQMVWNVNSLIY